MSWTAWPSGRKATLPPNWPTIRLRILERDHHRCQWPIQPGEICGDFANEVDHKDEGGPHDHSDGNLRSLCTWHHAKRSASQGGRARAAKGSERRKPERHPGLVGG